MIVAFSGWNDAGESATSAVRYVADAIHAAPLADIDPENFYDFTIVRPTVRRDERGARQIEWPSNDFRFGEITPDREVVTGVAIEPHLHWRAYTECIADLVSTFSIPHVVLVGAYLAEVVYSRPVLVSGFASQPDELARIGVAGTAYEGPTGIVGVIADRLMRDGVRVTSLWAGLPHYIAESPNPRGTLALLRSIEACLDIRFDDSPLVAKAAEFQESISQQVADDPELSEYVRQLKRREFAQ